MAEDELSDLDASLSGNCTLVQTVCLLRFHDHDHDHDHERRAVATVELPEITDYFDCDSGMGPA